MFEGDIRNRKRKWWLATLPFTPRSIFLHAIVFLVISLIQSGGEEGNQKNRVLLSQEYLEEEPVVEFAEIGLQLLEDEIVVQVLEMKDEEGSQDDAVLEINDTDEEESELVLEGDLGLDSMGTMGELANVIPVGLLVAEKTSGSEGLPKGYQGRTKVGRGTQIKKFGGSIRVLTSVEKALDWLAAHQNADGSWGMFEEPVKLDKQGIPILGNGNPEVIGGGEEAGASKKTKKEDFKMSTTGTALLAFLGSGYSEKAGKYRKNVRRGVFYLNSNVRKSDGKPFFEKNYGSAIVLMALSEASIFGSSTLTTTNAKNITKMFCDIYKERNKGWGYHGAGNDFSVSGWVALGLKSAKSAGLPFFSDDRSVQLFNHYRTWVETMTDEKTGMGKYRPSKGGGGTPNMTLVGMFQRQFLGYPQEDPFLTQAATNAIKWVPGYFPEKPKEIYGIYYGTLAAFQQQGELWKVWNQHMQRSLVSSQEIGDSTVLGGSWAPGTDTVSKKGGRVMTTALLALCLEVYYRYALMY